MPLTSTSPFRCISPSPKKQKKQQKDLRRRRNRTSPSPSRSQSTPNPSTASTAKHKVSFSKKAHSTLLNHSPAQTPRKPKPKTSRPRQYSPPKKPDETDHVAKLRQEAYEEFYHHVQSYNDSFVARMRYQEEHPDSIPINNVTTTSSSSSSSSVSSISSSTTDSDLSDIITQLEAGSVKDYTLLLEHDEKHLTVRIIFCSSILLLFY